MQYFVSQISPHPIGLHEFITIPLNDKRVISLEKRSLEQEFVISPADADTFVKILDGRITSPESLNPRLGQILMFEQIPEGLQDYY
ncbi:MAG: hypothetical protein JXA03_12020 [Bacteroidales bacterium]|nr:hypothetical protein [Bacteroidales bacterium]